MVAIWEPVEQQLRSLQPCFLRLFREKMSISEFERPKIQLVLDDSPKCLDINLCRLGLFSQKLLRIATKPRLMLAVVETDFGRHDQWRFSVEFVSRNHLIVHLMKFRLKPLFWASWKISDGNFPASCRLIMADERSSLNNDVTKRIITSDLFETPKLLVP